MMFESKMPQKYWVEALSTSNFLSNLLPTTTLPSAQSPYQKLYGKPHDYSSLRTFGCACFPILREYVSNKFDPRSLKCVFLGYNEKYKGYRCLFPPTGRVYISRHVIFDESFFPFANIYQSLHPPEDTPLLSAWHKTFRVSPVTQFADTPPISTQYLILISSNPFSPFQEESSSVSTESDSSPSPDVSQVMPTIDIRERSERAPGSDPASIGDSPYLMSDRSDISHSNQPPPAPTTQSQYSMVTRLKDGISKPNPRYVLLTHKISYPEPKTVTEALKAPGWTGAMEEEIDTCEETNTWSLVPYTQMSISNKTQC